MGLMQSGPSCRVAGSELIISTKEDVRPRSFVLNFFRLLHMLGIIFFMIVIGYAIEKSNLLCILDP